jgi:hypothetical protein
MNGKSSGWEYEVFKLLDEQFKLHGATNSDIASFVLALVTIVHDELPPGTRAKFRKRLSDYLSRQT